MYYNSIKLRIGNSSMKMYLVNKDVKEYSYLINRSLMQFNLIWLHSSQLDHELNALI